RPPRPTLSPYTTLFRSELGQTGTVFGLAAFGIAKQRDGSLVGHGDPAFPVHHQHAGTHAADDQLVDLEQVGHLGATLLGQPLVADRKSTRLNSSHVKIS